jgi:uncharacterized protein (TIGR02301 family)
MRKLPRLIVIIAAGLAAWVTPAAAQDEVPQDAPAEATESESGEAAEGEEAEEAAPEVEPPPPVYDEQLLRLSELLGALSFLRDLCGAGDGDAWRQEMQALLAAEQPTPMRRSRLVGRFNHGFETFNAVYRRCTPSARQSIRRYLAEGETISAEIRSRYGQ